MGGAAAAGSSCGPLPLSFEEAVFGACRNEDGEMDGDCRRAAGEFHERVGQQKED